MRVLRPLNPLLSESPNSSLAYLSPPILFKISDLFASTFFMIQNVTNITSKPQQDRGPTSGVTASYIASSSFFSHFTQLPHDLLSMKWKKYDYAASYSGFPEISQL